MTVLKEAALKALVWIALKFLALMHILRERSSTLRSGLGGILLLNPMDPK